MITKILYLIITGLGFFIPAVLMYIKNNKYKLLSKENFIYSYIFFIIFFLLFSKIFPIILQIKFNESISIKYDNRIITHIIFITRGYSLFFGYLGGLVGTLLFFKILKKNNSRILFIYFHQVLLMISILKLGCFINGCCFGINRIPVQLIESIICLLAYIVIDFSKIKEEKATYLSILVFFLERLILYFFRASKINLYFIVVQTISLMFVIFCYIKINFKKKI